MNILWFANNLLRKCLAIPRAKKHFIEMSNVIIFFWLFPFTLFAKSEPPNWIPKDAVEIKNAKKLLVSEGVAPEELKLGDLETGKTYFVRVHFVSMLDRPFKIVDIRSSCGCLVGAMKDVSVGARGNGEFIAMIRPEFTDTMYAKSLVVSTDVEVSFQVLLSARFKSSFVLEPSQSILNPDSERLEVKLKCVGNGKYKGISVQSKTGFTKVADCKKESGGESWIVTLHTARELFAAVNASRELVEALKVYDDETGKAICEVTLKLESGMKMLFKPSVIRMESRDQKWLSNALIFGSLEMTDTRPVLELRVSESKIVIPVSILSKEKNLCRCRIEMDSVKDLAGKSASGFLFVDGVRCGLVELIVFPKE